MQSTTARLEAIVEQHAPALYALPEDKMTHKPSPSKWSKKEIMGHLVDSAQNNLRRFIVAQYEENPAISYNQDKWVAISNYQYYKTADLIQHWELLNKHISAVLKNTSPEMAQRSCMTDSLHTIEWLAQDYVKHLEHHLHQVLEHEPVAYP
jgi:hypothetical protein